VLRYKKGWQFAIFDQLFESQQITATGTVNFHIPDKGHTANSKQGE